MKRLLLGLMLVSSVASAGTRGHLDGEAKALCSGAGRTGGGTGSNDSDASCNCDKWTFDVPTGELLSVFKARLLGADKDDRELFLNWDFTHPVFGVVDIISVDPVTGTAVGKNAKNWVITIREK